MSEITLVVAHSFGSGPDAEMAKSALEAAGIDAVIQADAAGGMRPHLAWASGGFKILVREEDAPFAREVLQGSEDVAPEDERG